MSARTAPRPRRRAPLKRRRGGVAPPEAPQLALDPVTAMFRTVSDRERARYRGAGVRVGSSPVVHARADEQWMLGQTVPAPACHAGFGVNLARLSPVHGAVVTCGRCLRAGKGAREPAYTGQERLF